MKIIQGLVLFTFREKTKKNIEKNSKSFSRRIRNGIPELLEWFYKHYEGITEKVMILMIFLKKKPVQEFKIDSKNQTKVQILQNFKDFETLKTMLKCV